MSNTWLGATSDRTTTTVETMQLGGVMKCTAAEEEQEIGGDAAEVGIVAAVVVIDHINNSIISSWPNLRIYGHFARVLAFRGYAFKFWSNQNHSLEQISIAGLLLAE
jgi:hypothetical protein